MEKREYHRFNTNLVVRYRILESLKLYDIASSEDMSEKGIKIKIPDYIEPNTRLELIIKIPGDPPYIMVLGKVVWTKKDESGSFYTTGIHIVHIKEEDKQRFYKCAFS